MVKISSGLLEQFQKKVQLEMKNCKIQVKKDKLRQTKGWAERGVVS